jgi:6-phospho-3-hexuloisomerase
VYQQSEHMDVQDDEVEDALLLIRREVDDAINSLESVNASTLSDVADMIASANRVFVLGAGRSGLALRMTAMRLMHLGLKVHVVGEVTAPAIAKGDLLLTASGSGTTTGTVRATETAIAAGAKVALLTATRRSPLATLSSATILVSAADKVDRSAIKSAQYAGSLFEQTVVFVGDAIFHTLWQRSGIDADQLWPRHANLE